MTEKLSFWIRDDRHGDPIVHMSECTCPSVVSQDGNTIHPSVWESEGVDNLAEFALGLGIEPAEIHIGRCVPDSISIHHGWGRRFRKGKQTNTDISPELGDWVRSLEEMTKKREEEKDAPIKGSRSGNLTRFNRENPKHVPAKLQYGEHEHNAGRPASAHANCEHPRTKAARAKCRRERHSQ